MEVRLRSPLPQVATMAVGATAAAAAGLAVGGAIGLGLLALGLPLGGAAVIAWRNLGRHEGWAVVVGADALELPAAPVRGRRRDRIPYGQIAELVVSPEVIVLGLAAPAATRWIRARDLIDGDLAALAAAIRARVEAAATAAGDKPVGGRAPA